MTDWRKMLSSAQPAGLTPATVGEAVVQPPLSFGVNVQPDAIEWMPPGGAEKLRLVRQRPTDANALVPKFEERHEIRTKVVAARQRLKRLKDHRSEGVSSLRMTTRA